MFTKAFLRRFISKSLIVTNFERGTMKRKGIKRSLLTLVLAAGLGSAFALETNEEITILQALQEDENFSTLVSLLESTGLSEELSAAGDITVFAPTNEAFEALGEDQLTTLSEDTAALSEILQLHVMQGEYPVLDLSRAEEGSLTSLSGEPYVIEQTASGLAVNDGDLVSTDVDNFYSNGVVHVISNVLVPAAQAAADDAAAPTTDTNGDGVIDDQDAVSGATDTTTDTTTDDTTGTAGTDDTTTDDTATDDTATDDTATDDTTGADDTTGDDTTGTDTTGTSETDTTGASDTTDTDGDGELDVEDNDDGIDTDGDGSDTEQQ
jgi:uncharacterized surface protein with fasciclin (FAS1) repeats